MENVFTRKDPLLDVINQVVLGEKKLTDAELKKREEIAQAIERENPGMDMGKKMAIATAQAKKVAEEAEQIDEADEREVSDKLNRARDYERVVNSRHNSRAHTKDIQVGVAKDMLDNAHKAVNKTAVAKFLKTRKGDGKVRTEEVEQIDELSKGTLGKYIGKAVVDVHNDAKWAGESGSKDASNKAFKRLLGVKSAAARLSKQNVSGGRISNYRSEEAEQIEEDNNNDLGDTHDDAYEAAKKVGIKPHSIGKHPKHPHLIRVAGENGKGVYNRKTKTFHKGIDEEVEQIDELSRKTLSNYVKTASRSMHRDTMHGYLLKVPHDRPYADQRRVAKEKENHMQKSFKRLDGIHRAANKLAKEEVNLEEQLENFWGAYLTCLDEAKDDASQQALLLRAMAKDPSDLMKMKRAIALGDKALTNPVMRQEILKMLDQMMNLTVTDKALLQKTRSSFMKQKQFKAADTTNTEEYVPEEVEELDERNKENAMRRKMMDASRGARYKLANKVVPDREPEHKTAQAHNKAIGRALRNEEVEELDELSKGTLGNYIKKAATGMNGMAVHAHMSGSASSAEQREKHFDKAFKRGKGIAKAADKLTKEEVEEIDEVSKKTLGSYIKKATNDVVNKAVIYSHDAAKVSSKAPPTRTDSDYDKLRAGERRMAKRSKGIDLAVKKLTKEEVEELDEANIPVHHVNKAVSKVLGTKGAVRFAMHHRPGTDKHTSWDKVNSALMKQGVKTKHIADIAAHLKPAQYNEEVEELDEISKKTLGSYIKKANADANDNAVRASWETSRIAVGDPNDPGSHNKANKYIRDLRNRKKGISRATDKLTKEEVDEAAAVSESLSEASTDKTLKVVKHNGKPIGEIGIDSEASPGNGPYYVKLYDGTVDEVGFDTPQEAMKELNYIVKQVVRYSDPAPFEGGRKVKSSKPAAERVKKIAKGMQKKYTKKD